MKNKIIYWLRRDFRIFDNSALSFTSKEDCEIIFLYIYDKNEYIGSASKWFLHHAIKNFSYSLKNKFNCNLLLENGNPIDVLKRLNAEINPSLIVWNRLYDPYTIKRDSEIKNFFKEKSKSFSSYLINEPHIIKNKSGEYFKVFTPYFKECITRYEAISKCIDSPKEIKGILFDDFEQKLESLNLLPKLNWAKEWSSFYDPCEENALNIFNSFYLEKISNYKKARDFPSISGTSKLSPYLHYGLISPKYILHKIFQKSKKDDGAFTFLSEIFWREFAYNLIYNFSQLNQKNFKSKFDDFAWSNDKDLLKKWQEGKTGFPIIDAGMRELWKTGWMHNRVRMIVGTFLVKNLLIDWRFGEKWFADCLIDYDLAVNSASWQWVAGSGAEASPFFRIFNPLTQSVKFDENGDYIRKWVSEISHLNNQEIHSPTNKDSYFSEIVSLSKTRERALRAYKDISNK